MMLASVVLPEPGAPMIKNSFFIKYTFPFSNVVRHLDKVQVATLTLCFPQRNAHRTCAIKVTSHLRLLLKQSQ